MDGLSKGRDAKRGGVEVRPIAQVTGRAIYRRQLLRQALILAAGAAAIQASTACARPRPLLLAGRAGGGAGLDQTSGFEVATARLQAAVDAGTIGGAGLLVARPNAVVYTSSVGSFSDGHVDEIASATKLASASTIMTLVDDGTLSLDDPVSRYLPSFTGANSGAKASITLRQCLVHTSGLPGYSLLLPPPGADNGLTLAQIVERLARLPLTATPGTRFAYGGVSYQIAGRVAEVASGTSWADLFQQRIAAPLNLTAFSYGNTANPRIGGGASASLRDYGNLLLVHLSGGLFNGRQILSQQAVAEMQRSQTGSSPFQTLEQKQEYGYGLSWWFDAVDAQGNATQISDAGAFGAIPWIDLGRGYGAFLFVRDRLQTGVALYNEILPLIQHGIDA